MAASNGIPSAVVMETTEKPAMQSVETSERYETTTPPAFPRIKRRSAEGGSGSLLARLLRSEATQELMARYIPEAVRDHIQRGLELDCGEREVTVLFVDLHGFTGFAEPLGAAQVFDVLSAYTRSVSRQIQRHGGTVVEFSGDGLMAVFGALEALENKERAGVAAARAMVHEVRRLRDPSGRALPVGVGIATGNAYVGSIQSADRMIWSAVGNTTNLASRLQKLAQELSTPIVLDAHTRRRAGTLAGDFLHHPRTSIRGRKLPMDVWVLPERQTSAT